MSEKILNDILMESYKKEFEEFDSVPPHKPSLRHRIAMKKIFKKVLILSKNVNLILLLLFCIPNVRELWLPKIPTKSLRQ